MEGPRQRRAPAQPAHPGGLGKKEEEAAVMGDARGVKKGPGPPAWQP